MASEQSSSLRCESPSPDVPPSPALGGYSDASRSLSAASDLSHGSITDYAARDSLGSLSSGAYSRQSSASYASSRLSTYSTDGTPRPNRRRGYMRPQGTAFAASAQSRESVMSLGSIAHLQYYFARTGLLDGKGAQLQRKNKQNRGTLDLSSLDTSSLSPPLGASDVDSSYASMGSSPELAASGFGGMLMESPIDGSYDFDDFEDVDPDMLPPTVSTYVHREKPVARPPTIEELKSDLRSSLEKAAQTLNEVRERRGEPQEGDPMPVLVIESPKSHHGRHHSRVKSVARGWHEIQGVTILDVMTLAIRAAKMYYTAHEQPERLDSIRSERQIRADLFSVMETLKQMATRRWAGGIRKEELENLDNWITGLFSMLRQEEEIENEERKERTGWTWVQGDWTGRETEREIAFMASLAVDLGLEPLPAYTPASNLAASDLPTPFLKSMQNGLRLVKLHNAAVKKSKRRFGGVDAFHTDTEKPYRCADNLRYWVKAAELRWEVLLKVDALGVVYNSSPEVWVDFEAAIWKWCRKVREELTAELDT